jgi:hypothetical protein
MSRHVEGPAPGAGLPSEDNAARSLHVLRRFAFKIVLFAGWAALQGALGHGFLRQFASMALISAILAQGAGLWRLERVSARHWTYFDEAAWFLMLALALDRLAL